MWGRHRAGGCSSQRQLSPQVGLYLVLGMETSVSPFCCISLTCWEVFLHVLKNQISNFLIIFSQPYDGLVLQPVMTTVVMLRDARCNAHFSRVCLDNLSFSSLGLFLSSFHLVGKKIKDLISFECSEVKFPQCDTYPSPPSPSSLPLNREFRGFRV